MKTENEVFSDKIEGFIHSEDITNSVIGYLSMMPKLQKGFLVRQFIIFHKKDLSEVILEKMANGANFFIEQRLGNFFTIQYKSRDTNRREKAFIIILPSSSKNISRITSISDSFFWNNVIKRNIKKFYPDAMPVFFRQSEIEQALYKLEKGLGYQFRIRIADVTVKEERNQKTKSQFKRLDTQRWWTELPISEVFSQAQEKNQWFSGVRFVIQKRVKNSDQFVSQSTGRLSKFGELSIDSFYSEITTHLLSELESQASRRLSTLDGRSLRERDYVPVKPIEIRFEQDVFSNIEEIHRFGDIVTAYPNSTKAVFHSNPYYHASVADFIDGSSFEVWILSLNKVILLPQAKSSAQAFERFISHVSSNFYEGVVDEYQN
ncbi:MAG: hypothetical protein GYA58_13975 [Anaerolineaceae bacterium]|nr:hypothetical protein [Anaerolineaceae bacterium]